MEAGWTGTPQEELAQALRSAAVACAKAAERMAEDTPASYAPQIAQLAGAAQQLSEEYRLHIT